MSFMQKQITSKRNWWEVDGTHGTEWFDSDDFSRESAIENYSGYYSRERNGVESVCLRSGYGCRMTAPGYLDCTEWAVFNTVAECNEYLNNMYEDDEEESESVEA